MQKLKPGDLVTVSERVSSVTVWTNVLGDDVEGYIFPGEIYLVSEVNELCESLRFVDTKNGLGGWISQNGVDKVK